MAKTTLEQMRMVDIEELTRIVRQDQNCPDFIITDWDVELTGEKGLSTTGGLFRFFGQGGRSALEDTSAKSWQVLVKTIAYPSEIVNADLSFIWHWKREIMAIKSGILPGLATPFHVPRIFAVNELEKDAHIWMEYVEDQAPPRWNMDLYMHAAHLLGQMNGSYLAKKPLPDLPWLGRNSYRGMYETWKSMNDHSLSQDPDIFSVKDLERFQQLQANRENYLSLLDQMPQTFIHGDAQRRNLLNRVNHRGEREIVMVDWALCGIGPVGADLQQLIGSSAVLFEIDPDDLEKMDACIFPAYMDGLRDAGCEIDSDLVRLSYLMALSVYPGMIMATWYGFLDGFQDFMESHFGCRGEEMKAGWKKLFDFILNCSDQAQELIKM